MVMRNKKTLLAIAAVPVLGIGWYLFRPELLFVNSTVNEQLPTEAKNGQESEVVSMGQFVSQAHETKGAAEIVTVDGKQYLQLKDFHTSNGPDVRVYLVKSTNPDAGEVLKAGFLDLGTIKGNIGSQSYEIPQGTMLDDYGVVSIWCKRFAVGFGAAKLAQSKPEANLRAAWQTVGFAPTEVTFGSVKGSGPFAGKGSITEDQGKRFVNLSLTKFKPGHTLRLVRKETLTAGPFPKGAEFVALGEIEAKTFKGSISKSLDLWLYRSLAVLDSTGKVVNFVNLRSAQEGGASLTFA